MAASLGITTGPDDVDDATWIELILGNQARSYLDESAQATADAMAAAAEAEAATVAVHDGTVAATITAPSHREAPRGGARRRRSSRSRSRSPEPPREGGRSRSPFTGSRPPAGRVSSEVRRVAARENAQQASGRTGNRLLTATVDRAVARENERTAITAVATARSQAS